MNEEKRKLINQLFKALTDSKVSGVLKDVDLLSDDPERWGNTKSCLFVGGRYIEASDKKWALIYRNLVSLY